ncbi:MAG: PorT family protein [Fibromonadaceae bacterium]|nr:PorT family protein [Fibromonadaceae bacterium]
MNRIVSIAAIVALVTTFSFAESMQFGVRVTFNMNDLSTGNKNFDKETDMGMGLGGGLVAIVPLSGYISLRTGAEFHYKTLVSAEMDYGLGKHKMDITELAISVPAIAAYSLGDAWAGAGVQIDIPISTEQNVEVSGAGDPDDDGKESRKFKDRSMDFGIAIGVGYNVSPNIGVDFKTVIGLTSLTGKSGDDSSMNQYGVGLSFFF